MALPIRVIYVAVPVLSQAEAERLQDWLESRPLEEVAQSAHILHGVIRDNLFHEEPLPAPGDPRTPADAPEQADSASQGGVS